MANVDVQGGEAISLSMNKGDVNTVVDSSMDNYAVHLVWRETCVRLRTLTWMIRFLSTPLL